MKIHLSQIPPGGLHVEGEEDCAIAEVKDVSCLGPLRYKLDLGISNGALWATGSLAQKLELRCVACLDDFPYEIDLPAFALHTDLPGPETIDLTPFMREDILLNLPPYPRCDREGDRVCPATVAAEKSADSAAKARKRAHDWEALDKLRLKG